MDNFELIVVDATVSAVTDAGAVKKVPAGTVPVQQASGAWVYRLPSGQIVEANGVPVQITPQQASALLGNMLKNQKQLRVGPIWHRQVATAANIAGAQIIRFFDQQPADTFAGNFKQALIKTKMDIYGARIYFEPAYYMTSNEAAIDGAGMTVVGRQQLANRLIPCYNAIARSICLFKVNRKDLPYLRTSKLMSDLRWAEWGYDNNAGAAAWSSAVGVDPNGPYFLFRTPEGKIDPIKLDNSVNEVTEVMTQLEFPVGEGFPALADIPGATVLPAISQQNILKIIFELFATIEDSLYAG